MNKNIITLLLVGLSVLLASCEEDFMETKSTQDVEPSQVFETTKGAMMAVNGLHKLMNQSSLTSYISYAEGGFETFMIWMDMLGEDLVFTEANAQYQTAARWELHRTIGSSTAYDHVAYHYRLFYNFIANANQIIDNTDNAEGPQSEKDYIKGQAYAYRAFAYYHLVQAWGERYKAEGNNTQLGVILRTTNSTENLPRSTVEEVYTQINSDLDEAVRLLAPLNVKRENKSHIDIHVARGLKARVLLTQGKWREAAELAQLVTNNAGAKLQDDTYITLANRMSDQTNTEWLWGKKSQEDQAGYLSDFHSFMSNMNVSYNRNTPRAIYNLLYNRITDTDVRKKVWFPNAQDPDFEPHPVVPTSGRIRNYMANKFVLANETAKCGDVPYMRLPEMILIAAEGYARAGEYQKAAQTLYPLAHHRDPAYQLSAKTGNELIDEIMFQRRIELWGEGFRWLDLKRLNLPLDRGPATREALGYSNAPWNSNTQMPVNVDPEASNYNMYGTHPMGEENRYKAAGIKEWQWLFPNIETDVNPLCEQNPI
ncbi:SusD family protein [Bacteroidales bacterium Barb6XT]|nr:SusD family protein [Bacteroidales bacterium Barb6XT]